MKENNIKIFWKWQRTQNVIGNACIAAVTIFGIYKCVQDTNEFNTIKSNLGITYGKIDHINKLRGINNRVAYYKYKVNTVYYEESRQLYDGCCKGFYEQYFPVVYSKKNPTFSRLLIDPKDFEEFDLAFPDSLISIRERNRRQ